VYQVVVRSVDDGNKFWVGMPEHGIDFESSDLQELKDRVCGVLNKLTPVKTTDYLKLTITFEEDNFPGVDVGNIQFGIDANGKKLNRPNAGAAWQDGWPESGAGGHDSWRNRHCCTFYFEDTKANKQVVELIKAAFEGAFGQLLNIFKVKRSGSGYSFKAKAKQEDVDAALLSILQSGLLLQIKVP
jgi:hypothetical protein